MPVQTAILTAKVTRQADGRYRLDDGVLTGRIAVDDLLSSLGSLRIDSEVYVCQHPELYGPLKSLVCSVPDLAKLPSADFTGARCDAVSLVLQFSAVPAAIGRNVPAPTQSQTSCGLAFVDTCASAP
jgi:hypothetical protein